MARVNERRRYHILKPRGVHSSPLSRDPYELVDSCDDRPVAFAKASRFGKGTQILDTATWTYLDREDKAS